MKIALIGNPNCGKTTLFNSLTGATAKTGNWPGVTVEKKVGTYKYNGEVIDIIDLPGIYSLSPYSPEEVVSRNYILNEKPDVVVNILDVTNLERNLYLTLQLMETDVPVVLALNMMDIARRDGYIIDTKLLKENLKLPVVEISALKKNGLNDLIKVAKEVSGYPRIATTVLNNAYIEIIHQKLEVENDLFYAVKLVEGDTLVKEQFSEEYEYISKMKGKSDQESQEEIANARYAYISEKFSEAVKKPNQKAVTKSDKIDKVLTNRWLGLPLFAFIMFMVFHFTFSEDFLFLSNFIQEGSFDIPIIGTDAIASPGIILFNAMDFVVSWLTDIFSGWLAGAPAWCTSLLIDGVWGGVGAILSFVPNILALFFFITILEDCGYMARVAFLMDKLFKGIGLSGKAFVPLISCFGCAVPGIVATKTLESAKERRITVMLSPFFSCGAKAPIWTAFAVLLFGGAYADLIVLGVYFFGIFVAVLMAWILNKLIKGDKTTFIMELPDYHLPQAKNVAILVWEKCKHYVVKAGTLIAASIVVLWFLTNFGWNIQMVEDMDQSILGSISSFIAPIFTPLGFGQSEYAGLFVIAAFAGLIAKEEVPAVLEGLGVFELAVLSVSPSAIFAFMAFNLLVVPCMAAVAAARGELNNRKHFALTIGFWILTAYVFGTIVFLLGSLIEIVWWTSIILGVVIIGLIVAAIVVSQIKLRKEDLAHRA